MWTERFRLHLAANLVRHSQKRLLPLIQTQSLQIPQTKCTSKTHPDLFDGRPRRNYSIWYNLRPTTGHPIETLSRVLVAPSFTHITLKRAIAIDIHATTCRLINRPPIYESACCGTVSRLHNQPYSKTSVIAHVTFQVSMKVYMSP